VPYLVAYISRFMTLDPGDIIATGTPAGVGAFRKPPLFLKGGDRIKMEIERIGVLETTINA
jgi:2-keto-4-pentenoate hydratase/2-oxohepta-3-ene-1,7-dioic acid hydratase in catechol pathway